MGIFSKLFGRKKKDSPEVQNEPKKEEKKTETSDEVTLEEVNDSLDEVNTITKDEPVEKEQTKPSPQPKTKKPTKDETESSAKDSSDDKPLYHIRKHSDGWQIIKENADKAYRVFSYQKEAIEFANKENLKYQVYKADGTLRK